MRIRTRRRIWNQRSRAAPWRVFGSPPRCGDAVRVAWRLMRASRRAAGLRRQRGGDGAAWSTPQHGAGARAPGCCLRCAPRPAAAAQRVHRRQQRAVAATPERRDSACAAVPASGRRSSTGVAPLHTSDCAEKVWRGEAILRLKLQAPVRISRHGRLRVTAAGAWQPEVQCLVVMQRAPRGVTTCWQYCFKCASTLPFRFPRNCGGRGRVLQVTRS